jgi:hypothetical protein
VDKLAVHVAQLVQQPQRRPVCARDIEKQVG